MYGLIESKRYAKSLRRLQRAGLYSAAVKDDITFVITFLVRGDPLPEFFLDHQLKGEHAAYRECHIKGNLLLMYWKNEQARVVVLADIGTHSQLFE